MVEKISKSIRDSKGYILVDSKKCQGCLICMLACSLVHEGEENLSLSRIQIIQNSFSKYPGDIVIAVCRQCLTPSCVEACPTGALHIDPSNGNIKIVDIDECNGCQLCIEACPYQPRRILWNFEKEYAMTCDLCVNTPFWNKQGEPGGMQACVSACPIGALQFTNETPIQEGDSGYEVNLRGRKWEKTGYPIE